MFSPYTPGAGKPPPYLAGREEMLADAAGELDALNAGHARQPTVYFGLRGVGKTVLLRRVEQLAEERGILCVHIEATENKDFKKKLVLALRKVAFGLSATEKAKSVARVFLAVLRSFQLTWTPKGDVKLAADAEALGGVADSGDLENDLTDLLCHTGRLAQGCGLCLCFFIDERQYLQREELDSLIVGLHRVGQLELPVALYGAGLPKMQDKLGQTKTYTERQFGYVEVGSLGPLETNAALEKPAQRQGTTYTAAALQQAYETTAGYPFFVQKLGGYMWKQAKGGRIGLREVEAAEPAFYKDLDRGFFRIRWERTTKREKNFLYAMARCSGGVYTIKEIAQQLQTPASALFPLRGRLIDKGLLHAVKKGELQFSVPLFDEFLRRENPGLAFI